MISVVTLYSTICVQDHWGIQIIALYGTYICVSLCACASLITLLADYQISPVFKTLIVMFLDESSIVAYFAKQHAHYLSTVIANLLIARSTFLLNALLHAFILCSIALYIILNMWNFKNLISSLSIYSFSSILCSVCANCVQTLRFL